ncbi:MAG: 23S rRNA pseudouridine(2605) synthase RluB, partial [Candidatus Competibacterales bacterium]
LPGRDAKTGKFFRGRQHRPHPRGPAQAQPPGAVGDPERLHKYLARFGVGSRRQVEDWIRAGRLTVDGTPATLGQQVTGREAIALDGQRLRLTPVRRRVLAYYKPVGEVTSRDDPEGRPTVFAALPRLATGRWISVGRLDLNTQGLLLVTTDGELAHRLMHPASAIEREYAVRILGPVDENTLARLRGGVELEDGPAHFDEIIDVGGTGANHWYHVILKEGRQREVRRLWESQGFTVSRLVRVGFGPIALRRGLKVGRYEELDADQCQTLLAAVGLEAEVAKPPTSPPQRRSPHPRGKPPRR